MRHFQSDLVELDPILIQLDTVCDAHPGCQKNLKKRALRTTRCLVKILFVQISPQPLCLSVVNVNHAQPINPTESINQNHSEHDPFLLVLASSYFIRYYRTYVRRYLTLPYPTLGRGPVREK